MVGSGVYEVDDFTVLHSGCDLLGTGMCYNVMKELQWYLILL